MRRMYTTITAIILICVVPKLFATPVTALRSNTVHIYPDRPGRYRGKCVGIIRGQTDIKLKCARNDIIYSIDVNMYNSTTCNDNKRKVCSGLQLDVLVATKTCYSEPSCKIEFNNFTPIMVTSEERCIGRWPNKLKLSYNCVRKALVHHLFQGYWDSKANRTWERKSNNGMLISHEGYPWNYPKGLTYELVLKPQNYTKTKLFISVPVMELNGFGDVVLIGNYSGNNEREDIDVETTAKGKSVFIRPSKEPQTSLKFYTDRSHHSAKGFVICYYWTEENTDLSNVDICSRLKRSRRKKGVWRDLNLRKTRKMKRKGRKKGRRVKKQKSMRRIINTVS